MKAEKMADLILSALFILLFICGLIYLLEEIEFPDNVYNPRCTIVSEQMDEVLQIMREQYD